MARRSKAPPAPAAFEPYLVSDPFSMVRGPWLGKWLVLGPCALGAVRAVGRTVHMEGVGPGVVDRTIWASHLPNYRRVEDENFTCQSILEGVKKEALEHGATPLAVQWLNEWTPFTEQEMTIMAEKLKTKPAKAAAEKKAPAKKGNPEALAKAREARASAAQEDRKYKTLVKRADIKTREGTWTEAMVDIIMSNKSTDAAKAELAAHKEYGDRRLDFSWAEKKGYISF